MTGEVPTPRRRVRTGCLTCRGRRRKCDEARPTCENCKSKNLTCRYGVNVTFVTAKGYREPRERSLAKSSAPNVEFIPYDAPAPGGASKSSLSHDTGPSNVSSPHTPASQNTSGRVNNHPPAAEGELNCDHTEDINQGVGWDVVDHDSNTRDVAQTTEESEVAPLNGHEPNLSLWRSNQVEENPNLVAQDAVDEAQEQYELELLHHYRYRIATILDLGLGNLHYGIQVMLDARRSPCVYKSILAVSSCHRAATESTRRELDKCTNARAVRESYGVGYAVPHSEALIRSVMTAVTILMTEAPQLWIERLHPAISQIPEHTICHGNRPLLARLVLAATMMASHRSNSELIRWFLEDPLTIFGAVDADHPQRELQAVLALLADSVRFLHGAMRHGKQLLHAWQLCWEKLGMWYTSRTVEMQEILQLSDANDILSHERMFPFILFSNATAIVVNVVYHLAATLLLQNKPRLVKPSTRYGSSSSSVLHTQRLIGIADTAIDAEIWDPIVAVAVVHSAKRLSHYKQRYAAAQVLGKIIKVSGMKLETQIDELMSPEAI